MAVTVFLWINALLFIPYGLFCLVRPEYLGEAAGVAIASATGSTEIRAMYGGLQTAVGALALGGALRSELRRPALFTLLFLFAGLGVARAFGLAMDASASTYTFAAIGLEFSFAALAAWALNRAEPAPAV